MKGSTGSKQGVAHALRSLCACHCTGTGTAATNAAAVYTLYGNLAAALDALAADGAFSVAGTAPNGCAGTARLKVCVTLQHKVRRHHFENHHCMKRVFRKTICCAALVIAGLLNLLLLVMAWNYASCPIYAFEEPKPFSGPDFYNPYQGCGAGGWKKCVFHLHSRCWGGLTEGDNSDEEVYNVYRKLRFDVVCISDYMCIDRTLAGNHFYIPVYEHGYGVKQVHQLALGARGVVWRDYMFAQNLHQKQHIIELLKKHSRHVSLNHPARRRAYPPEELAYLSGYDFLEVLNTWRIPVEREWDAALSNGHLVWVIANDDAHNVNDPSILHIDATFVNVSAPAPAGDDVLDRMEQGVAFGVRFPPMRAPTFADKEQQAKLVSFPKSIQMYKNRLYVSWQQAMERIEFIGDNGAILKTVKGSDSAFYPIRPHTTYVRVKLTSPEGLVYFLNPVVRCTGGKPARQSLCCVDKPRTFCKRAIILAFFCGGLAVCGKVFSHKRHGQN